MIIESTIWEISAALITVVLGLVGLIYGMLHVRKSREELQILQRYRAQRLPNAEIESLAKKLSEEVPIEGLADWKYESFLRHFDNYDDSEIGFLNELNLERWLNLQKEIVSLSSQLSSQFRYKDVDNWEIHEVIACLSQFFDKDDNNLLLGLRLEFLERTLTEIRLHRSHGAAQEPAKSTEEGGHA